MTTLTNQMNIQQFQYILAVEETQHFEKAAQQCFVTQSTLSTMILKFEKEIGLQIFDRRKKPVGITNEGRMIIAQLRHIQTKIDELAELTKEIKGEIGGRLHIGCIPTVAPFLLPKFLQKFSIAYPSLFIEVKELTTGEIIRQIKSRELDVGIVSTPLLDKELIEYPVYEEPFVLYQLSQKHVSQKKITISEIDPKNFWLLEEGHCMRNQVLEICDVNQIQINPALNINFKAGSIDSLLRFVRANNGKTLLPYLATLEIQESEKQHLCFFEDPAPSRTVGLVVHSHFAKKKILKVLQKELVQVVEDLKIDTVNCSSQSSQ